VSLCKGHFSIDEFFVVNEFAKLATIRGLAVSGIFDRQYVEYTDIAGNHPTFLCPSEQVSNIELGDEITINQKSYTIAAIQPDGTGLTLLVLHEA
jgi:hypothetical protein